MFLRTPWLEHKFNFNLPEGQYPEVVERLRGTPARLEELIGNLRESAYQKGREGKWTVTQLVGHLRDVDELFRARLEQYISGDEILVPADMSNQKTEEAGYEDMPMRELLARFREFRMAFVNRLETVDPELIGRTAYHERLDVNLRLIDLACFVADHDDHHLAEITFIARQV